MEYNLNGRGKSVRKTNPPGSTSNVILSSGNANDTVSIVRHTWASLNEFIRRMERTYRQRVYKNIA